MEQLQAQCVELVEATLYQCALDPDETTDRIFYLKTANPEKCGDRLRADQIEQIKAQALQQVQAGLEEDIAALPKQARDIVIAALRRRMDLTPP